MNAVPLFAEIPAVMLLVALAFTVLTFGVFAALLASRYTKVGINQALIVSGRRYQRPDGTVVGFRIVKGGGIFVLPFLEKVDLVSLEMMNVEFKFPEIKVGGGMRLRMVGSAQVKIGGDDAAIHAAAERFSNKREEGIKIAVLQSLLRHFQTTLQAVSLAELDANQQMVIERIKKMAAEELTKLGLELASVTVTQLQRI